MKSTKTYANKNNPLYKLIKDYIEDSYFLEVLYFYIRLALKQKNFNLSDITYFNISGKHMGYDIEVYLNRYFDNVLKSLSLLLSLRAFLINKSYFKYACNDDLLFYSISSNYLSWDAHRVAVECLDNEDFSFIYKMINCYKDGREIPEELIEEFNEKTIRPEYRHHEEFCKELAARGDDYNGRTVIKNNQYLYSDIDSFVVDNVVEYVGNTVFAYCENLKEIEFEGKVMFGHFPIVECNNLQRIIVPAEYLDYYKTALPYYKNIICDPEHQDDVQKIEEEPHEEERSIEVEEIDDLQIEHVYLDSTSADSYVETEVEPETTQEAPEPQIDFGKLDEIFERKATSYKYFWFLSIISLANERKQLDISYKDILIRMAAMAWPMIFEDDINLGKIDMMAKHLSDVEKKTTLIPAASSNVVEKYLSQHFQSQGVDQLLAPLLKNVPYRFLSPWIKYTSDDDVIAASNRSDFTGLYALKKDGIALNATWWNYIQANYRDVCNNAIQSFIAYIKEYNDGMSMIKLKVSGISFIGKP